MNSPTPNRAREREQATRGAARRDRAPEGGYFLPLLLMALTLVLAMGFQLYQGLQDRRMLWERYEQQSAAVLEARKVRRQLETIAGETYALSLKGNKNAARLVEQLRKAGFRFDDKTASRP